MPSVKVDESVNFDKVLDKIGKLGRFQILHLAVFWFSTLSCGMLNLANVFFAAVPDYWCHTKENNATSEFYNQTTSQLMITIEGNHLSRHGDDPCSSIPEQPGQNNSLNTEVACSEWIFDTSVYGSNIITEWEFVCSSEWLASLSQTTFMLGIFIGGFISGILSDRFGRKNCWFMGLILMTVSGTIASFMTNYWAFIGMRVLAALGNTGTFISGFVLMMEILAPKYRVKTGVFYQLPFAAGYMTLSLVAYFIRDFRHLNLFIALFPILSMPFYCFVYESPRWLLTKGRFDDAEAIVMKMCKTNKQEYPENLMTKKSILLIQKEGCDKVIDCNEKSGSAIDLIKRSKLRCRLIAICYGWILCSLTYYGLSQASADLDGGPYLNLFLSGLMEFPGIIFCAWLLDKIGRKWTMAGVFFLSGLCVLLIPIFLNNLEVISTILSMIGKMAISGGFAVIFVYTAELFPTVVRTLALGIGSMSSRIGSITSPNIILLSNYWVGLPFFVFGGFTLLGAFVTLVLPETLNQPLQETIEDAEQFGKGACGNICDGPCVKQGSTNKNGEI